MRARNALIFFAVMLAIASTAAIGVILPSNYPVPPAITPQQTAPVAPQAPVPLAPPPGHPGGIYTQVVATCYGPLRTLNVDVSNAYIVSSKHISADSLSSYISFAATVRDTVQVNYTLNYLTYGKGGVNITYVTVSTQPGIEVNIVPVANATAFHVSPGVWIVKNTKPTFVIGLQIYGEPISNGSRNVIVTFSAQ